MGKPPSKARVDRSDRCAEWRQASNPGSTRQPSRDGRAAVGGTRCRRSLGTRQSVAPRPLLGLLRVEDSRPEPLGKVLDGRRSLPSPLGRDPFLVKTLAPGHRPPALNRADGFPGPGITVRGSVGAHPCVSVTGDGGSGPLLRRPPTRGKNPSARACPNSTTSAPYVFSTRRSQASTAFASRVARTLSCTRAASSCCTASLNPSSPSVRGGRSGGRSARRWRSLPLEERPRHAGGEAEPRQAGGEADPGRQTCARPRLPVRRSPFAGWEADPRQADMCLQSGLGLNRL